MASFGPLQRSGGVALSNFDFAHLSIHAIQIMQGEVLSRQVWTKTREKVDDKKPLILHTLQSAFLHCAI